MKTEIRIIEHLAGAVSSIIRGWCVGSMPGFKLFNISFHSTCHTIR